MSFGKDTRRGDKFKKGKDHFKSHPNHKKKNFGSDNGDLIREWHDTQNYFNQYRREVPKSIKYDIEALEEIGENVTQEIIHVNDAVENNNNVVDTKPIIEIANEDTFNMGIKYCAEGYSTMVLNMASDYRPGGGVASGKTAQEEELFRRSNAHLTHPRNWYPLTANEIIYSPEVTVVKDTRDNGYEYIDEVVMSMIACAAVRKPKLEDGKYDTDDYEIMYKKIESIFKIGILHNHDALVLGALGCGAFDNPPTDVANICSILVTKYGKYFKKIGFAILVVKEGDTKNLDAFTSIIKV